MRPSTIVTLIVLMALIFVPAFFINMEEIKPDENAPLDSNGRDAPAPPQQPAPGPQQQPAANTPPGKQPVPPDNAPVD